MTYIDTFKILQGYRLGNSQATTELKPDDMPSIHIEFDLLKLVSQVQSQSGEAVILTGTAGDGKTYLAYRIIDALGLNSNRVRAAQLQGGYHDEGIFIDLDLSAGPLIAPRLRQLHQALSEPQRLTLVCANEGKLAELESRLNQLELRIPDTVLRLNLSRRALISPEAWTKVLHGTLAGELWATKEATSANSLLMRNRAWLQDPVVSENVRRYLLIPYLMGEPITIREMLSFLAYILTGDLTLTDSEEGTDGAIRSLPYLLFNTVFSEPSGYVHGGRAVPGEKLLWWLFRFDPGVNANPEADLRLLTQLDEPDRLKTVPPPELFAYWRSQLVFHPDESSDTEYRQRVNTYMRYARRWYALACSTGFDAYFPFRYFERYLQALLAPSEDLDIEISTLIKGLNLLLSGGQVADEYNLNLYYLTNLGGTHPSVIYSDTRVSSEKFQLTNDLTLGDMTGDRYLERHPRRLYLCYPFGAAPEDQIRLPVSLLLYEVLMGAASPESGFPATLWAKERHTVARFMGALNQRVEKPRVAQFVIAKDTDRMLKLAHDPRNQRIIVS